MVIKILNKTTSSATIWVFCVKSSSSDLIRTNKRKGCGESVEFYGCICNSLIKFKKLMKWRVTIFYKVQVMINFYLLELKLFIFNYKTYYNCCEIKICNYQQILIVITFCRSIMAVVCCSRHKKCKCCCARWKYWIKFSYFFIQNIF